MKKLLSVLLIFALMLPLSVCAGESPVLAGLNTDEEITLTIQTWGSDVTKANDDAAIARFMEKYPNVKVEVASTTFGSWTEYINTLLTRIAAGNSPDVLNIAIEGVYLAASRGIMEPLDGYMTNDPTFSTDYSDVDPAVLKTLSYEGQTYFLPASFNGKVLYYNTKLFDAAGLDYPTVDWTWDDLLAAAQKLTTGAGTGADKVYGFALPFHNWLFGMMPYLFGTSTLTEDWSASNLDDPKVAEAYQFMYDLVYKYGVCPPPESAISNVDNLFVSGRVAMQFEGPAMLNAIVANGFTDYGIELMPQAPDGSGKHKTIYGSVGVGVVSNSPHKDYAWELVKEMCGPERMAGVALTYNGSPAKKSIAERVFIQERPPEFPENAMLYYDLLEDGIGFPCPVNFTDYDIILGDCVASFMGNQQTVAEALAEAHEKLQKSFEEVNAD